MTYLLWLLPMLEQVLRLAIISRLFLRQLAALTVAHFLAHGCLQALLQACHNGMTLL